MTVAESAAYQNYSMRYTVRNGVWNPDSDRFLNQTLSFHGKDSELVRDADGNIVNADRENNSELRFGVIQSCSVVGQYGELKPYTRCITANIKTREMIAGEAGGEKIYSYHEEEKSFDIFINCDGKNKTYTIKGIDENGQEIEEEFDPYDLDPKMMDFPEFSALCMYIRQTDETADLMSRMVFTDTGYFDGIFEKGDRVPLLKDYAEEYREVNPSLSRLAQSLFDAINEFLGRTMWSGINDENSNWKYVMGSATSRTTSSANGENIIGIMTIGDRVFAAKYADSSTEAEPVIKVGNYEVRVNDVDPRNATKVEMFALMSYMDDKGLIENTGIKSFNKMMAYGMQAEYNGFCSGLSDPDAAWSKNRDWTSMLENAKESFLKMPQAYHQGLNCRSIIEGLMRWSDAIRGNDTDKFIGDYSEKEWDRMLSDVDQKISDMSSTTAEEVGASKESFDEHISDKKVGLLTARYTTYETGDTLTDPDTGQPVTFRYVYRTFYTREGIVSGRSSYDSREGVIKDKYNWEIDFKSEDDYERVMNFLDRIPEGDYTRFLTKENFWQDYLNGEIDDDEFFEYYETLDHGKANFIKQDENGNNYIDQEMMNSKYFKYIGIEQLRPVSEPELLRGLELSALKDRGYDHSDDLKKEDIDLFATLREALVNMGTDELGFYGEEGAYSINEWIQELIRRTHMGMMDSLFA